MLSGLDVLLVCDDAADCQEIEAGLMESGVKHIHKVSTQENVLKWLGEHSVDVIVIDVAKPSSELFSRFGILNEYCPKPIICFSKERDTAVIAESVKVGVTAYIVDGKSAERIQPIIEVAMMRFNECYAVRKELEQVKDKLSERGVIERAKGLLIEHRNMSEDQAYKTMRKMAMDQGKKISVIAHEICDVISVLAKA